jgi:hypothetical protein
MRMMLRKMVVMAGMWVVAGVVVAAAAGTVVWGQTRPAGGTRADVGTRAVAGFGKEVALTLSDVEADPRRAFFNFSEGKVMALPGDLAGAELARWGEAHADAGADALNGTKAGIFSRSARFAAMPAGAWEQVTAGEVRGALAKAPAPASGGMAVAEATVETVPAAYAFETKEGAVGVLEIVSFTAAEVRVRYMVVEKGREGG